MLGEMGAVKFAAEGYFLNHPINSWGVGEVGAEMV